MPDPFVLAIALTFLVVGLGALFGNAFAPDATWIERLRITVGGWKSFIFEPPKAGGGTNQALLYFAFQMCLMLVTGHALAASAPVSRAVGRLARLPRSFPQMVFLTAFVACFMALLHWGLGLIVGAMMARQVGQEASRRGLAHHYPLLGAAGYTGLMIWGGGLSGSIPLKAVRPLVPGGAGVPLSETLFSSLNLIISGSLLVAIPLACLLLVPAKAADWVPLTALPDAAPPDATPPDVPPPSGPMSRFATLFGLLIAAVVTARLLSARGDLASAPAGLIHAALNAALVAMVCHRVSILIGRAFTHRAPSASPADRADNSELLSVGLALMGLGWLEYEFWLGSFHLSLNTLNVAFLFLGILFQGTPRRYVQAATEATRGCAGIILQFPLYFGILGVMVATGLGAVIAQGLAEAANHTTYPLLTYLSAGLVNLFVPSGGGQWVVQGRIVIDGAAAWPAIIPKSVMALTYGDAWTNMLQPFWAVPLLAITKLRARDIIGYTAAVMLLCGALTVALLLVC